jgi:hypothetical protein
LCAEKTLAKNKQRYYILSMDTMTYTQYWQSLKEHGAKAEFCRAAGITWQYGWQIAKGDKTPSEPVARAIIGASGGKIKSRYILTVA